MSKFTVFDATNNRYIMIDMNVKAHSIAPAITTSTKRNKRREDKRRGRRRRRGRYAI